MAKRIVEGLWDCPYCGTRAIGGLTKTCPCCGHPQDTDTRFYMGNKKHYLEADLAAEYGQGPDWVCPYCNSLNRIRYKYCSGCGAPKESASDDYFSNEEKAQKKKMAAPPSERSPVTERKSLRKKPVLILAVLLALLAVVLFAFWPRNYTAEVRTRAWARSIDIEAWVTVQESDWSVPDGGRTYERRREIHHYVQVLDHYETRTRQVAKQVYDGEETHTSYSNNGDGTFTENTYSTPRYRTEYETETYKEPVYRSEPVYETKYYYEIERWVTDRTEKSSGADNEPYWPEYTLADNERTGYTGEVYNMALLAGENRYTVYLPLEWWETFRAGDQVEITVSAGKVTKLNGREL